MKRATWQAIAGTRAAGHPRVAPELLADPPEKVSPGKLVRAVADAAFEAGWGIGSGDFTATGLRHALADVLYSLGCDSAEALAGIDREFKAGRQQGEGFRRQLRAPMTKGR